MPNPLVSQLKLARELEEKAKHAKKLKEDCEKILEEIERKVDKFKNVGIDISSIRSLYEAGKKDYEAKEFENAISKLKEVQNILTRIEDEKIDMYVSECERYLALLRDMGRDISQYQVEIEKTKQKSKEDIEIGIHRFKELRDELVGMIVRRIETEIGRIREGILGIEKEKREEIELKLNSIVEKISSGNINEIISEFNELQNILKDTFEKDLGKIFEKGEQYENILREMKVNILEAIEIKGRAKELLTSMQFYLALEHAKKYLEKLKEILDTYVKKSIDVISSSIQEGKEIEADVREAESLLEEAKKKFSEEKYQEVLDILKRVAASAEKAKFQRVLREISQSKELFVRAREMGIDIKPSIDKLEDAKKRLKEGKYKLALTEARRGLELIERQLNRIETLRKAIKELRDFIDELKNKGIEVSDYLQQVSTAESLIDSKPDEAESIIDSVRSSLETILYDMAMQKSEELETFISLGKEHGLEFTEEKMDIDRILEYVHNGEHLKALELAATTKVAILTKLKRKADEILSNLENFLKAHEIPEASKLLIKASNALKEEDFVTAFVNLKEASEIVSEARKHDLEKKLQKIEEELEFLASYGADVSSYRELIIKCKNEIPERFHSAIDILNNLSKELSYLQKNVVRDIFHSAKTMGVAAKKIGVKIEQTEVRDLLVKAKEALEKGDIRQAIRLSARARDVAREYKERAEDIYKILAETARKISTAKEKGVDVTAVARMLVNAKKYFEENKFDDAEKLAKSTAREVENLLSKEEVINISKEITELSKMMEEIGIGIHTHELATNLSRFKALVSEKNYFEANKLGKDLLETIRKGIEEYLTEIVAKLEKNIYDMRQEGIIIQVGDDKLSALKDCIIKGEYRKCYELYSEIRKKISETAEAYHLYQDLEKKYNSLVKTALSINLQLPEFSKELEEAKNYVLSGRYGEAIKVLSNVCKDIEKRIMSKLYTTLRTVEDEIKKAKARGMRVDQAESTLQKAKNLANQFKVNEAIQLAMSALNDIERAGLQKEMAYSTLIQMEQKVRKMYNILPIELQNKAKVARSLFESENYSGSLATALEVMDKIAEIENTIRILKDVTERTKKGIEMAYQLGLDVSTAVELYNKAKQAFENKRFIESLELIKNAHKSASTLITDFMMDLSKRIDRYVELAKRYGIEEATVTRLAKEIREHISREEHENAFEKYMELGRLISEKFEEEARKKLDTLRSKIASLSSLGVDTKSIEVELKELEGIVREGEYKEFFQKYEDLLKKVEGILPRYTELLLSGVREMLRKYSNLGIDLSEYENKLSELMTYYDEGAYDKIIGNLNAMRYSLRNKLTKEFTDILMKLERRAKEVGIKDVSLINRMAETLARGDFDVFLELKNEFEKRISKYLEVTGQLRTLLRETKEKMDFASKLGIDISYEEDAYRSAEVIAETDPIRAYKIAESIISSIDIKISDLKPRFNIDILPYARSGNTLIANLIIENVGNAEAKNVEVVVGGDAICEEEIKIPSIKVNEKVERRVNFRPIRDNMNLVVTVKAQRFDGLQVSTGIKKLLSVSQFPEKKNFEVTRSDIREKCSLCRGIILERMENVLCRNCGSKYHLPCIKRVRKCVVCGSVYDLEL